MFAFRFTIICTEGRLTRSTSTADVKKFGARVVIREMFGGRLAFPYVQGVMMYVKLIVSNCANDVDFRLGRCERVPFGVEVSLFSVTTKFLSHAVIATLSGDDINLP